MKKRKKQPPKNRYPKGLLISDENGIFKLYKIWQGGKTSDEPIVVTEELSDFVDSYTELCTRYKIKPKVKEIKQLINKYNKKEEVLSNESNLFKGRFS